MIWFKVFLNVCPATVCRCCGWWEGWVPVNRFNHTSRVTVTLADRSKSIRNRCVIKVFGGDFYVVVLLFGFFCWCRGFCHRTESDLFLFLFLESIIKEFYKILFKLH